MKFLTVLFSLFLACAAHAQSVIPTTNGSSTPTGAAGGELGGTYPNPTISTAVSWTGPITFTPANAAATFSPTGTGTVTISPATAGTINAMSIGQSTTAAGSFTTLSASSTVSGTGFSTYLASPPAIGGSAAAAGSFTTLGATGLISPASAIGIKGTATNDNAQAASVGEIIEANCPVATSGTTVSFTNASPTVGTWSGSPWSGTGTYACPMNITANAPTGLSTATNYWITPINATTFHVSTTAANAMAGTYANTSATSATANLTTTALLTTATAANLGTVSLTAGDWECVDYTYYVPTATTSVTNLQQGITQTSATIGALGTYTDFETAANVMTVTNNPVHAVPNVRESLSGTTNVYSMSVATFTASTLAGSSDLRCRRAR